MWMSVYPLSLSVLVIFSFAFTIEDLVNSVCDIEINALLFVSFSCILYAMSIEHWIYFFCFLFRLAFNWNFSVWIRHSICVCCMQSGEYQRLFSNWIMTGTRCVCVCVMVWYGMRIEKERNSIKLKIMVYKILFDLNVIFWMGQTTFG